MIKIRIHLDGHDRGFLEYVCKETMEQYLEFISSPSELIGLIEIDSKALISIPVNKYVVEAWSLDD